MDEEEDEEERVRRRGKGGVGCKTAMEPPWVTRVDSPLHILNI